jgi:hypothetical protein
MMAIKTTCILAQKCNRHDWYLNRFDAKGELACELCLAGIKDEDIDAYIENKRILLSKPMPPLPWLRNSPDSINQQ